MKVYIQNLYGVKDGRKAYYRKQGLCFDFSYSIQYASELTREEAERILSNADFFKKMFNADTMRVEEYTVYEVFPDGKRFFRFESDDHFECEVYVSHHKYDHKISKLIIEEN